MSKKKILHIADDMVFVNYAMELFEEVDPGGSVFLVNVEPGKQKKVCAGKNVVFAKGGSKSYSSLIDDLERYRFVMLHGLFSYKLSILDVHYSYKRFHCAFWGQGDLYRIKCLELISYLSRTREVVTGNLLKRKTIELLIRSGILRSCPQGIPLRLLDRYTYDVRRVAKTINSASTVVPSEIKLVENHLSKEIKYLPFSYASTDQYGLTSSDPIAKGTSILVGNSAFSTNNHIDVIDLIISHGLSDREIILPLSYGGGGYARDVERYAIKHYPGKVTVLKEYISLEQYYSVLRRCEFAFIGTIFQQAMGNVMALLWFGVKIYLFESNQVYEFLRSQGMEVFTFDQMPEEASIDKEKNREVTSILFSKNSALANVRGLIDYYGFG